TRLMRPAAERLAGDLDRTRVHNARIPVVVNTSAQPVRQADQIRRALLDQVTSAVLWEQSIRVMYEMGARQLVEIGPGTTLSGMIRKTVPAVPCHVEDVASRDEALDVIFGQQVRRAPPSAAPSSREGPGGSGRRSRSGWPAKAPASWSTIIRAPGRRSAPGNASRRPAGPPWCCRPISPAPTSAGGRSTRRGNG